MTRGPRRHGEAGFTLIEVLLASAIMATLMTLLWASFSATARSKKKGEAIGLRYREVRLAMGRMAREISMAYLSKNDDPSAIVPRTMFIGESSGEIEKLTFSSFAHERLRANAKECDQTLITYFGMPDREDPSKRNLMRRATARLGTKKPGEEGPAYVLLEDVVSVKFEYFDGVNDEWRTEWNTKSVDGQPYRLPRKVRVTVVVKDEKGEDAKFITATRVHMRDAVWGKAE